MKKERKTLRYARPNSAKKESAGCLFGLLTFILEMLGLIPGIYIVKFVDDTFNNSTLTQIAVFIFPFLGLAIVGLLMACLEERIVAARHPEVSPMDEAEKYLPKEPFEKVPHFGKLFGDDQVDVFIGDYKFSPYIDKKGNSSEFISLSEDKKWMQLLGSYLPLDLLCGYNENTNFLYTIDGAIIQLPKRAQKADVKDQIREFLDARGMYYKFLPSSSEKVFNEISKKYGTLSRADWSRMRYEWEKNMLSNKKVFRELGFQKYTPHSARVKENQYFFERVLTANELENTALAVRRKKIPLSDYLVFEKYKNEYSVCNGIELIKLVNDSQKKEGLDFLFDCLRDVDEAFFIPAAELLKELPADLVFKKMEKNARRAYENRDANRLAGILYLSKLMGHETEYIRKKKEEIRKGKEEELQKTIESVYDTRKYVMYMLEE